MRNSHTKDERMAMYICVCVCVMQVFKSVRPWELKGTRLKSKIIKLIITTLYSIEADHVQRLEQRASYKR